ncbi:MAG: hypothetical protein RBU25_13005, partial [Lentisphaeria bacterium]|nr:hypothetical protein [Lentisphaeria bacterium]
MGAGSLFVIAVCVLVLCLLVFLRGKETLKGEIPKAVAMPLVLVALLVAAAVLYRLSTAAPAVLENGGVNQGAMMEGGPGGGGMGGGGMGGPNP